MEMKINGRWVFRAGAAGFTATPKIKTQKLNKIAGREIAGIVFRIFLEESVNFFVY
jgi:hypothetical protein